MRNLLIAAALTLAACSPGVGDPAQTLIGHWGDNGNCSAPLTINADGTFETGGAQGEWTLKGNHLTMSGKGGTFAVDLAWQDHDHMTVTHPDGSIGHSQRCS